jgi:hypothetical protein
MNSKHPTREKKPMLDAKISGVKACVLDVYGTLFDVHFAWVNCFGKPPKYLTGQPNTKIKNLDELPPLLGL